MNYSNDGLLMKKIFLTAALLTCSPAIRCVQAESSYAYAQERLEGLDNNVVQEQSRVLFDAFITLVNDGRCEMGPCRIDLSRGDDVFDIIEGLKNIVEFLNVYTYTWEHNASLKRRQGVEYLKMAVFMQAFQKLLRCLSPDDLARIHKAQHDKLQKLKDPQVRDFIQGLLKNPQVEHPQLPQILEKWVKESVFVEGPLRLSEVRSDLFRSVASILDGVYKYKVQVNRAQGFQESRSHRSEEAQLWKSYAAGEAQRFTDQLEKILEHKANVEFLNSVLRKIALSPVKWSVGPSITQILTYLDDWFLKHPAISYKACVDYKVNGLTILDEVMNQYEARKFNINEFRDRAIWLQKQGAEMTDHVKKVAEGYAGVKKILDTYGFY